MSCFEFIHELLSCVSWQTLTVLREGAPRLRDAVLGAVQQSVIEADVVGAAHDARRNPVYDAGPACVVQEGS